jgi:hypothetical protein
MWCGGVQCNVKEGEWMNEDGVMIEMKNDETF